MDTFLYVLAMMVWVVNLWLGLNAYAMKDGFDWVRSPKCFLPIIAGSFVIYCFVIVPQAGNKTGLDILFVAMLMAIAMAPSALLFVAGVGEVVGTFASKAMTGSLGIRNVPSFDQAMAMEKRHDFSGAEQCYLDYFKQYAATDIPEEDCAEARLAYGNLLQRLGRMPEAAEQWERAAAGNLQTERAQVAARRAAEFHHVSGNTRHAQAILRAAIGRHPREPVTESLRLLLDSMAADREN